MAAKKTAKKTPAKETAAKDSKTKAVPKESGAGKTPPAKKVVAKKAVAPKGVAAAPKGKAAAPKAVAAKPAKKPVAKKPSLVSVQPPPAKPKPKFVPPAPSVIAKSPSGGVGSHSASFIKKQQQRLLDLRDMLLDSVSGMSRDTIRNAPEGSEASGSGQHQGDAGSDAYDRDFALSVLAKEQDALYEIEQALYRIKAGTYGSCEISNHKIPTARLEAIPFARLTVECQAQWEKEYGSRRFRPSDEVGFSGGMPQEDEQSVTVSLDGDDD